MLVISWPTAAFENLSIHGATDGVRQLSDAKQSCMVTKALALQRLNLAPPLLGRHGEGMEDAKQFGLQHCAGKGFWIRNVASSYSDTNTH